jgi:hypothetical protein
MSASVLRTNHTRKGFSFSENDVSDPFIIKEPRLTEIEVDDTDYRAIRFVRDRDGTPCPAISGTRASLVPGDPPVSDEFLDKRRRVLGETIRDHWFTGACCQADDTTTEGSAPADRPSLASDVAQDLVSIALL